MGVGTSGTEEDHVGGGIYHMQDDGQLVKMNERGYVTEALLQGYLADHPDLLAGDQIDSITPRRWLLVAREAPLASEEDGAGRWSVDHLFLDQDAVPTIVEVKRSTDTRIRREVVGQMLDYAANGVVYWSVDRLRAEFMAGSTDHEQALSELLEDPEADPEEFWQRVKINLQAGKVRLIFVSDKIPDELRRIVEFLNWQMDPAEVLAVEIKQYVSPDSKLKTLVPRVVGHTEPPPSSQPPIRDRKSFLEKLEAQAPEAVNPAEAILNWAESEESGVSRIVWGKGRKYGTFYPTLDHNGTAHRPLQIWTDGSLYIQLGDIETKTPFDDEHKRSELLRRLNKVPGITISDEAKNKYPRVWLAALNRETALEQFLKVLDWFVEEVKAT